MMGIARVVAFDPKDLVENIGTLPLVGVLVIRKVSELGGFLGLVQRFPAGFEDRHILFLAPPQVGDQQQKYQGHDNEGGGKSDRHHDLLVPIGKDGRARESDIDDETIFYTAVLRVRPADAVDGGWSADVGSFLGIIFQGFDEGL